MLLRPSRDFVESAARTLGIYMEYRTGYGREVAFREWCKVLSATPTEVCQLSHLRVMLLQEIALGHLDYDDIDWSGNDVDRRASSTAIEWAASLEEWLSA